MVKTFISILLVLVNFNLFAHQQKQAITTVLFNDRSGNLEVMHRFYLHDAEHAISEIFPNAKAIDLHTNEKTQQQFAGYLSSTFEMRTLDGKAFPLSLVGYESDGRHFWLYQELAIPQVDGLAFRFDALRDVWPKQTNMINIEGRGKIKSLVFSDDVEWLSLEVSN